MTRLNEPRTARQSQIGVKSQHHAQLVEPSSWLLNITPEVSCRITLLQFNVPLPDNASGFAQELWIRNTL
jgi:hypothetical protein